MKKIIGLAVCGSQNERDQKEEKAKRQKEGFKLGKSKTQKNLFCFVDNQYSKEKRNHFLYNKQRERNEKDRKKREKKKKRNEEKEEEEEPRRRRTKSSSIK